MKDKTEENKEVPESLSNLVVDYCDPLFVSDRDKTNSKNSKKSNGTITYVKYKEQLWGITNSHVSECEDSERMLVIYGNGTSPVYLTSENCHGGFKSLRKKEDTVNPDIAIIKIGNKIKKAHFDSNFKKAIDLDKWEESAEDKIITPIAFGFPSEHKTQDGLLTLSPLVFVTGHISSNWSLNRTSFTFHAELTHDSNYFLSGISGGPIFHAENREDNPLIIGITYEGSPGSKHAQSELFGMSNVIVSGYTFSPSVFDRWLIDANFKDTK